MCDLPDRYIDIHIWDKQTMMGYGRTNHDVHILNVNVTVNVFKNSKIWNLKNKHQRTPVITVKYQDQEWISVVKSVQDGFPVRITLWNVISSPSDQNLCQKRFFEIQKFKISKIIMHNGHNGHIWCQIINSRCEIDSGWSGGVKRCAERRLRWFRSRDGSIWALSPDLLWLQSLRDNFRDMEMWPQNVPQWQKNVNIVVSILGTG